MRKRIGAVLLAGSLMLSMVSYAAEKAEGVSIRLAKTKGDGVTVSTNAGKALKHSENMRLLSGYQVETDGGSWAYLSLDEKSVVKTDVNTQAEIRKNGKKNEVFLKAGQLFFDVTEKLDSDETLTISSSNVVMGIRGSSGMISTRLHLGADGEVVYTQTQVQFYEGDVTVWVRNPRTGVWEIVPMEPGDWLVVEGYPDNRKSFWEIRRFGVADIPYFVLAEIYANPELMRRIEDATGLSFQDLEKLMSSAWMEEAERLSLRESQRQAALDVIARLINPAQVLGGGGTSSGLPVSPPLPPPPGSITLNGTVTNADLTAAFASYNYVVLGPGAVANVTGPYSVGAGQTLDLAYVNPTSGGTLNISGSMTVEPGGTLINNSSNTVNLLGMTDALVVADGATFVNSATGRIAGSGLIIMEAAAPSEVPAGIEFVNEGKIETLFVNEGKLTMTNTGEMEGLVNGLSNPDAVIVSFTNTGTISGTDGINNNARIIEFINEGIIVGPFVNQGCGVVDLLTNSGFIEGGFRSSGFAKLTTSASLFIENDDDGELELEITAHTSIVGNYDSGLVTAFLDGGALVMKAEVEAGIEVNCGPNGAVFYTNTQPCQAGTKILEPCQIYLHDGDDWIAKEDILGVGNILAVTKIDRNYPLPLVARTPEELFGADWESVQLLQNIMLEDPVTTGAGLAIYGLFYEGGFPAGQYEIDTGAHTLSVGAQNSAVSIRYVTLKGCIAVEAGGALHLSNADISGVEITGEEGAKLTAVQDISITDAHNFYYSNGVKIPAGALGVGTMYVWDSTLGSGTGGWKMQ